MKEKEMACLLALQNAVKFRGKANPKALLGAMVARFPAFKSKMGELSTLLTQVVAEVNALSPEAQTDELLRLDPGYFDKEREARQQRKEERKELPPLKNAVEGKVVTRIPPEPSKYNHLGHALSFLINYLYAQKYKGRCVLRFEDTNPEKATQEFVDAMREDVLEYLDIRPDRELFVSDDMAEFYEAAERLIRDNAAYVCGCAAEEMHDQRREMAGCPHREQKERMNLALWGEMVAGKHQEGSYALRLKIDPAHKNAVMRDPVIMRIVTAPHYRQATKYKVWPMYDFANALEDSWCGVTHIMRSNEFESRIELQDHIKGLLGLQKQEVLQYGRFNIVGATTQGREIRRMIEEGKAIGWDDPRLITLRALRRRGIVKEAYYELARICGMSKTQTNLDFGVLAAINRRILDEEAERYYFVRGPIKIIVEGWPTELAHVELKLHPHKQRGGRPLKMSNELYIAKEDYEKARDGKLFRLIDTANLKYDEGKKSFVFHSKSIDDFRAVPDKERLGLIHFLPVVAGQELLKARVFMPDATYQHGLLEPTAKDLKPGVVVQLERYGFCRLDAVEPDGTRTFWYTHQ
jgi:glutamyl-tRNA synthetase